LKSFKASQGGGLAASGVFGLVVRGQNLQVNLSAFNKPKLDDDKEEQCVAGVHFCSLAQY